MARGHDPIQWTVSLFAVASRASPPWKSCRPSSGPRWASRSGLTPAARTRGSRRIHGAAWAPTRCGEAAGTTERGGRAPNQRRGYLDPDAGRAFLTLWGTPWDTVSRHLCKPMYNKSLVAVVALTPPEGVHAISRQSHPAVSWPGPGKRIRPVQRTEVDDLSNVHWRP